MGGGAVGPVDVGGQAFLLLSMFGTAASEMQRLPLCWLPPSKIAKWDNPLLAGGPKDDGAGVRGLTGFHELRGRVE